MEITRNNYEAYFLDYLEGNLDEKLVDEFIEFLQQNPDLKSELKDFKPISLEAEELFFEGKHKLYKEKFDSEEFFDHFCIAILENDASDEEIKAFEEYLENHPEKEKEFELFMHTRLAPDEALLFDNKSKLYKKTTLVKFRDYSLRIAALLVLAFSLSVLLKQHQEISVPPPQIVKVAKVTEPSVQEEKPQKKEKKNPPKQNVKPVEKDTVKTEPVKSIREKTRGRAEEGLIALRDTIAPSFLSLKSARIVSPEPILALATPVNYSSPEIPDNQNVQEEILLGEKIKEKTGIDKFQLNDITKAGLKLFSSISKNKFSYDTNSEGEITELNLDTRLLAFSIPTSKSAE